MLKRTAHAAIALSLATAAVTLAAGATAAAAGQATDSPSLQADSPVVRTDKGLVRGTATDAVRTFQGIPYAAPPTGDRRWAPTAPAQR
ncbi:carboxylesterase family protein, partial [Streptomyces sp. T-3]|nr:carboxylesterase family protein [Streptomyces sp. T-3]